MSKRKQAAEWHFLDDSADAHMDCGLNLRQLEQRISQISLDLFKEDRPAENASVGNSEEVEPSNCSAYHLSRMNLHLDCLLE